MNLYPTTAIATTVYQKGNGTKFPKRSRNSFHLDIAKDNQLFVDLTAVATKAYFSYVERGFTDGNDVQDWLKAEAQIRLEAVANAAMRIHA